MQLGMIGLGRMGADMVRRLMQGGHRCVVHDVSPGAVEALAREGAVGASSPADLAARLDMLRAVWMMVPAAAVDGTIAGIRPFLSPGDILVDGGNSHYVDDIRRAGELAPEGIRCVDVGTSGGVWGLERGYCLMIGGEPDAVRRAALRLEAGGVGDYPASGFLHIDSARHRSWSRGRARGKREPFPA